MNNDKAHLEQVLAAYECFNCGILLNQGYTKCPMCDFAAEPPYIIKPVYEIYDKED